jgi:hypothetical protein
MTRRMLRPRRHGPEQIDGRDIDEIAADFVRFNVGQQFPAASLDDPSTSGSADAIAPASSGRPGFSSWGASLVHSWSNWSHLAE